MARCKPGVNDLATVNPKLASEWHPTENGDKKPSMFGANSHEKVIWLGECGHTFPARIRDRNARNHGCPFCSNQKLLQGFNDLETKYPDLAEQWDYDQNEKRPNEVIAGGTQKYHWRCQLGHSWPSTIPDRKKGNGCPYCGHKKLLVGLNDLATTHPDLAKEWDYDLNEKSPQDYMAGSNDYANWKCEYGHTWNAMINSRKQGNGCPYCAGQKVWPGINDLASKDPELAAEWDYEKNELLPSEVTVSSSLEFFWKCKFGHSWPATITNRHQGRGCPECDENNKTSLPEQAILFYISRNYPNSVNRYKELFSNGMELDIYIPSLKKGIEYDGPYHKTDEAVERDANKYKICRENGIQLIRVSIRDNEPEIPTCDVFIHSDYNYRNYEALDAVMESLKEHLSLTGSFNTKKDLAKIKKGYLNSIANNSLARKHSDLCKEWDYERNNGLTPEMFTSGSGEHVYWKCHLGHYWQADINSRVHGRGCPYCSNQKVWPGFNDLAYLRPDLLKEWDYEKNESIKPTEVTTGSKQEAWWICPKGHGSYPMKIVYKSRGRGCRKCKNEKVGRQFSKPVSQYSRDGKLIGTFPSATEAAKTLGVSGSAIANCCHGKSKSCQGFVFKYGIDFPLS